MVNRPATYLLETPRLWLREMTVDDAGDFYTLNADEEVIRYTGDASFASEDDARQFLAGYEQYRLFNRGRWAVIRKEDGRFLGWCGLKFHEDNGQTDVGFRLMKQFWSKGYSTEAAKACLAYGFQQLGLQCITAQVRKENIASIKVLRKLGLTQVREHPFDAMHQGYWFEITLEEWLSSQ